MGELPRLLRPWKIWSPFWHRRMGFSERLLPLTCVGLVIVLLGLPYLIINQTMNYIGWSAFDPATALDNQIPFIAWTIIPYSSLYIYYPLGAIMAPRNDLGRRKMIALYQTIFLVSWIIFLVFIFLPSEIHIRSQIPLEVRGGGGMWGWAYGNSLHITDKPWNAWPSLHIVQSLLIVLTIEHWWSENPQSRKKTTARIAMWLAWMMLAISILTTKQHFVWDLFSGIIVALSAWHWILKPTLKWCESDAAMAHFSN